MAAENPQKSGSRTRTKDRDSRGASGRLITNLRVVLNLRKAVNKTSVGSLWPVTWLQRTPVCLRWRSTAMGILRGSKTTLSTRSRLAVGRKC